VGDLNAVLLDGVGRKIHPSKVTLLKAFMIEGEGSKGDFIRWCGEHDEKTTGIRI
jgi:hypothetical protein